MIFLFRKLRKMLLSKNRFTTYSLYAIGEIFLVVIGILIAVQIDDWNNNRKQKIAEKKYFGNLKQDLLDDISSLNNMTVLAENKFNAANRVRYRINQDTIGSIYDFIRDIETLVFVGEFTPHKNTYLEMSSTGSFSSIDNTEIKLSLLDLYESYEDINGGQEHIRNDYNVFLEDLQKYIDMGTYYDLPDSDFELVKLSLDTMLIQQNQDQIRQNFTALINGNVFRNNIYLLEVNYRYFTPFYKKTKEQAETLVNLLDEELSDH